MANLLAYRLSIHSDHGRLVFSDNLSGKCQSFLFGEESVLQTAEIREKKRGDDDDVSHS